MQTNLDDAGTNIYYTQCDCRIFNFFGSLQKGLGDGVNETQARDVKLEMYLLHMHFRLGSAFKIRIGPTYVELFGD